MPSELAGLNSDLSLSLWAWLPAAETRQAPDNRTVHTEVVHLVSDFDNGPLSHVNFQSFSAKPTQHPQSRWILSACS